MAPTTIAMLYGTIPKKCNMMLCGSIKKYDPILHSMIWYNTVPLAKIQYYTIHNEMLLYIWLQYTIYIISLFKLVACCSTQWSGAPE